MQIFCFKGLFAAKNLRTGVSLQNDLNGQGNRGTDESVESVVSVLFVWVGCDDVNHTAWEW
jgi:hypothetical protein